MDHNGAMDGHEINEEFKKLYARIAELEAVENRTCHSEAVMSDINKIRERHEREGRGEYFDTIDLNGATGRLDWVRHNKHCTPTIHTDRGFLLDRIAELEEDRDRWKQRHELNMKVENQRIAELEARSTLALRLYHANYPGFIPCALKGEPIPQNILDVTDRIIEQELGGDDVN